MLTYIFIPIDIFFVISIIEEIKRRVQAYGMPCGAPPNGLKLEENLYVSDGWAIYSSQDGTKCLYMGEVAQAVAYVGKVDCVKKIEGVKLSPPFLELYEDEEYAVILGVCGTDVCIQEWRDEAPNCTCISNLKLDEYIKMVKILENYNLID
ncbi:conserved hypothetical protein [Thermoproteus tenax Kra 1]|uniref:Uncharacterized protein n=1 Tax=Thermoproteus tenax (strain ATCC 35583 / DSM 2078 / JCM 9277 / NBRC 100435 / Kra 1) TaxID=768679 RepID=G4RNE5_THETK|nr:conserved hypothetical protein [Thermoproteus tenax Kra 1]